MKILLVTMDFPPFKGGVANYYYNLVKNFISDEIVVLADNKDTRYPSPTPLRSASGAGKIQDTKKFKIPNFKIIHRRFFFKYFWPKWLRLYFEVRKLIKKEKFDLIWCGQVLPVGTVCYLISKLYKIPYFVSTHGMDIMLPQKSARKKKLIMNVIKSAKFITANSRFTKSRLLKLGINEQKIGVIYPCANISGGFTAPGGKTAQIRQKLGLDEGIILLSVGRLVKRKGYDKVIEAVSQLSSKFPDLHYLIVGDGPEKERYKIQVTRNKLNDKVKIFDDVSDEELPYYYQLADIFIMPARDIKGDVEGFGIVYLEAANFKVPVIAGRSGGISEAVIDGQTGILVDPESVDEIREAIIRLINDEQLRKELGERAYQRSVKEFNWENQAKKLISLLKKIHE